MRSLRHPFARPSALVTAIAAVVASPSVAAAEGDGEGSTSASSLDAVVVSATRNETEVSKLARSVTVVTEQEIQQQSQLDQNLGTILENTVPGIGASNEAATNFGQTLRGNKFLVLIDGIPQSTPLRDVGRDLNTISPSSIQRIEVIRGGTSVYGFGATGGLINIITKEASSEPVTGYSQVGASVSTEEFDDSETLETEHRVSGTQGNWDYVLSGSFVERNSRFDSEGRRIPPNPLGSQGGLADTDQWSLLQKTGYTFDGGDQRVEFMVNHLDREQDTDFTYAAFFDDGSGNPARGSTVSEDPTPNSKRTPAIRKDQALPGSTSIVDAGTENTTGRLTYTHEDLAGSQLRVSAYAGDFEVTFPRFNGFPQSRTESEKQGLRSTVTTPFDLGAQTTSVTWGFDYLGDETESTQFGPGAQDSVPNLDQDAYAVFGQVEQPIGNAGLVRAGARYEDIDVDVSTVQSNRGNNTILGDELNFSESLFNISGVLFLTDTWEAFGSFSQGFSIDDLGRVIRDKGPLDPTVQETFQASRFERDAEEVDNYELGIRHVGRQLEGSLTLFYSESDSSSFFLNNLQIQKDEAEVRGVEATLDYSFSRDLRLGGTASWAEGDRILADGSEEELPNTRLNAPRLTAYVEYSPMGIWNNRLQTSTVGDRDSDSTLFGAGDIDGYTRVDFVSKVDLGTSGNIEVSVKNLLNNDYFPSTNQAFDRADTYAQAPGRRLGVSYSLDW